MLPTSMLSFYDNQTYMLIFAFFWRKNFEVKKFVYIFAKAKLDEVQRPTDMTVCAAPPLKQ